MQIKKIDNRDLYDSYVLENESQFLQSWEWGEFQISVGNEVFRFGVFDNNKLIFAGTLIRKKLFKNKYYFYFPRAELKNIEQNEFWKVLKEYFSDANLIFIRFEPIKEFQISNFKFQILKTINVQPSQTMLIDLSKSSDELLGNMHQKTRYNVRLAKKKGVIIKEVNLERFNDFWELMQETGSRDDFRLHSKNYYKKLLETNNEIFKLFFAEFEDKPISAGIFSFYNKTLTYIHGASASEYRNMMAPYALQWELVCLAKERNYQYYDFYGTGEGSLAGVTRFKQGFGGNIVNYFGTYDLIFNSLCYNIYKFARFLRRKF